MKKVLVTGIALAAFSLSIGVPAQAQVVDGSIGALSAFYTGTPSCDAAAFGWAECAGAFTSNNTGASNDSNAGESRVLTFINANWLTNAYVADGVAGFSGTPGTITFNNTYSNFVLALKQGSEFSLFYFDESWSGSSLSYSTAGVKTGATTGLSHWTLYAGDGTSVPEPGMLLLMGTGLLGLAAVRRREDVA